jgi:hypothetical protein
MYARSAMTVAALAVAGAATPWLSLGAERQAVGASRFELEGKPLRVAALERDGDTDILLLRDGQLERFRLEGGRLVRTGAFRSPAKRSRPLLLDATPDPSGEGALVTAVFGEDLLSVDQGTDTTLHSFVLSAGESGEIRTASGDLGAYLRIADGKLYLQRRGTDEVYTGGVRPLETTSGRFAATRSEVPWARRWLLDATPLPGGRVAIAWDGDRPTVVTLAEGDRVSGGSLLGDLGNVDDPKFAYRLAQPLYKLGLDKEGRVYETWRAVPRRVIVTADGAAYTVFRGRSKRLLGKASGQDAVVRLDWSGRELAVARPYPGVEAFVLDFALLDRSGGLPAALLLVNEGGDGSGRAHLVLQELP